MNKRSILWFLLSFASLTFLISCAISHTRNREEIPEFIKKTCLDEYGLTVQAWQRGEALWIYSSDLPKGFIPPLAVSQWLKKDPDKREEKLFYNIRELDAVAAAYKVEYEINAYPDMRDLPVSADWQQDDVLKEQIQTFQRAIHNVAWRANLHLEEPFQFTVIITGSPHLDYDYYMVSYFTDTVKLNRFVISQGERQDRTLLFNYFSPYSRNDTDGSYIEPYDLPPNEFVATLLHSLLVRDINDAAVVIEEDEPAPEIDSLEPIIDIAFQRAQSVLPIYSDIHSFREVLLSDTIKRITKRLEFPIDSEPYYPAYMPDNTISKMFAIQFYYTMAAMSFQEENYEDLRWYCDKVFEIDPDYPFARVFKAQIAAAAGNWQEAISIYEDIANAYPRFLHALQGAAFAYHEVGDHQKALEKFQKISRHSPRWWQAYYWQGSAHYALGDYAAAVELYHRAQVLLEENVTEAKKDFFQRIDDQAVDKSRALIKNAIANVYVATGQHSLAKNYLDQSLGLDKNSIQALLNYGLSYQLQGKPDKAIEQYQKALALDRNFLVSVWYLGRAHAQLGQYSKAISYYQDALSLEPEALQRRDIYFDLGKAYLEQEKDPQKALFYFKSARELDQENSMITYGIVKTYLFLKDYRQVEMHSREIIKKDNTFAPAYEALGLAYFHQQEYQNAEENFIKAKDLYQAQGNSAAARNVKNRIDLLPVP
jgi:tetratricopeptide (TPR) repeat protein